jgi:hypothetical protein
MRKVYAPSFSQTRFDSGKLRNILDKFVLPCSYPSPLFGEIDLHSKVGQKENQGGILKMFEAIRGIFFVLQCFI